MGCGDQLAGVWSQCQAIVPQKKKNAKISSEESGRISMKFCTSDNFVLYRTSLSCLQLIPRRSTLRSGACTVGAVKNQLLRVRMRRENIRAREKGKRK